MSLSEDAVMEKLKNVIDPELFVNIVDLGLIYEIKWSMRRRPASEAGPSECDRLRTKRPRPKRPWQNLPRMNRKRNLIPAVGQSIST